MIKSHIARSVSLTSTLVKISERILLSPLLSGLEKNNFYNKNLYAYRKFHTMSHAIITLNEDMCDSLNIGRYRAVIIADLEGAFDAT